MCVVLVTIIARRRASRIIPRRDVVLVPTRDTGSVVSRGLEKIVFCLYMTRRQGWQVLDSAAARGAFGQLDSTAHWGTQRGDIDMAHSKQWLETVWDRALKTGAALRNRSSRQTSSLRSIPRGRVSAASVAADLTPRTQEAAHAEGSVHRRRRLPFADGCDGIDEREPAASRTHESRSAAVWVPRGGPATHSLPSACGRGHRNAAGTRRGWVDDPAIDSDRKGCDSLRGPRAPPGAESQAMHRGSREESKRSVSRYQTVEDAEFSSRTTTGQYTRIIPWCCEAWDDTLSFSTADAGCDSRNCAIRVSSSEEAPEMFW